MIGEANICVGCFIGFYEDISCRKSILEQIVLLDVLKLIKEANVRNFWCDEIGD
jgi:hypothetical protein